MDLVEKAILVGIFTLILSFGGCSYYTNEEDNRAIEALVEQGQTSEQAYCAIRGTSQDIACQLLITTSNKGGNE